MRSGALDLRRWLSVAVLAFVLVMGLTVAATAAEVATLRTPGPDAEPTEEPAEELDEQQSLLDFAACMRDNGIDLPDPKFGVGSLFASGGFGGIDFMSSDFLDAIEACESLLASFRPQLDPDLRAERRDQEVRFAECMREEGLDFPDPDPLRGFTASMMRSPDGGLSFDPFSPDFLGASATCIEVAAIEVPDVAQ